MMIRTSGMSDKLTTALSWVALEGESKPARINSGRRLFLAVVAALALCCNPSSAEDKWPKNEWRMIELANQPKGQEKALAVSAGAGVLIAFKCDGTLVMMVNPTDPLLAATLKNMTGGQWHPIRMDSQENGASSIWGKAMLTAYGGGQQWWEISARFDGADISAFLNEEHRVWLVMGTLASDFTTNGAHQLMSKLPTSCDLVPRNLI